MRIVELKEYLDFRNKLDKRITIYYSAIIGIVFFIFLVFVGIFQGIIAGLVAFVLMFLLVYGIRVMTNNGVDRKRSKEELNGIVLDVTFGGEFGLLELNNDSFKYVSLQKFGLNKVPDIPIDEDLFIGIGKYKFGSLQKLKLGEDVKCQITLKSMPHGVLYRFDFYNVNGALEKMTAELDKVNRFNLEKHQ